MSKELEALLDLFNEANKFNNNPCKFNTLELFEKQEIIEQALLKAQKQEKVLEIIKNKRVNANQLLLCWKAEMYNSRCRKGYELSKEEFNLLNEVLCNDTQIK